MSSLFSNQNLFGEPDRRSKRKDRDSFSLDEPVSRVIPIPIAQNNAPIVNFSLPRVNGSLLPALFSGELAKGLPPRINGSLLEGVIHYFGERERQLARNAWEASQPKDLSRGGRLDAPMSSSVEGFPVEEYEPVRPSRQLENPLGDAAARYLALSQPQETIRRHPVPQEPTFLDQSEEYRRKARALREKRHTQGERRPPAPAVKTVEAAVSDDFLRFVFQRFRDAMAHARTPEDRSELQKELDHVKRRMADNLVKGPGALKSKDGYIIIGDMAYGTQEAYHAALMDLDYFQTYGRHLPLKYPMRDYRPGDDIRLWPDVTDKVNKIIEQINSETTSVFNVYGKAGIYWLFYENFPNNGKWDLQVNYGLPGQIAIREGLNYKKVDPDSSAVICLTQDQYAFFKGKIHRAGYISNYAYGQAIAAGELFNVEGLSAARAVSLLNGQDGDNPDDTLAILQGYRDYRQQHSQQYPSPGSFRNK